MALAEPARAFLDTDVLLCLLSADAAKADCAESLLMAGAVIGVQVLNEFAAVARRKFGMAWKEIDDVLGLIRKRCTVRDLTLSIHEQAIVLAQRHALPWYDALIVAAALDARSAVLYSEDMQHGLRVARRLVIRNPFVAG